MLNVRRCRTITYTEGELGLDQMAREVQALVDKAVRRPCGPVPPVTMRVIPGSPATELTHAAQDADLLVVARVAAAASAAETGLRDQPGSL